MAEIRIRAQESAQDDVFLLWDTTWNQDEFYGDWSLVSSPASAGYGGLTAGYGLNTAIVLSLMTWRRAEPYELKKWGFTEPNGWWGDGVDVDTDSGEAPLGSKLWLLFRSALTDDVAPAARDFCLEALQPLVDQGAVASFTVEATANKTKGRLEIVVSAFSEDGTRVYQQRFAKLWAQMTG